MGINSREEITGNKIRIIMEGKTIITLGEVIMVIRAEIPMLVLWGTRSGGRK